MGTSSQNNDTNSPVEIKVNFLWNETSDGIKKIIYQFSDSPKKDLILLFCICGARQKDIIPDLKNGYNGYNGYNLDNQYNQYNLYHQDNKDNQDITQESLSQLFYRKRADGTESGLIADGLIKKVDVLLMIIY